MVGSCTSVLNNGEMCCGGAGFWREYHQLSYQLYGHDFVAVHPLGFRRDFDTCPLPFGLVQFSSNVARPKTLPTIRLISYKVDNMFMSSLVRLFSCDPSPPPFLHCCSALRGSRVICSRRAARRARTINNNNPGKETRKIIVEKGAEIFVEMSTNSNDQV